MSLVHVLQLPSAGQSHENESFGREWTRSYHNFIAKHRKKQAAMGPKKKGTRKKKGEDDSDEDGERDGKDGQRGTTKTRGKVPHPHGKKTKPAPITETIPSSESEDSGNEEDDGVRGPQRCELESHPC